VLSGSDLRAAIGEAGVDEMTQRIADIADAVLSRQADFLFGAGMSVASNLPTGHGLALKLLEKMFPDRVTVPSGVLDELVSLAPFEALLQAVEKNLSEGRKSLTELVKQLLEPSNPRASVSEAHVQFARIARWEGDLLVRRVFTTNFDTLLEVSLGDNAVPVTEENPRAYEEALVEGRLPIVYLHGRLGSKLEMTEADVWDTVQLRSVYAIFQNRLFASQAFTFIGYSMVDPDLRRLYSQYRDQLRLRQTYDKWTFVVHPVPSFAAYRLFHDIWDFRGARFIPLTAVEFFTLLAEAVRTARSERGIADILALYGWSQEELLRRVEQLKEALDLKDDEDAYELLRRLGGAPMEVAA
jgi:SIR2-like domain